MAKGFSKHQSKGTFDITLIFTDGMLIFTGVRYLTTTHTSK